MAKVTRGDCESSTLNLNTVLPQMEKEGRACKNSYFVFLPNSAFNDVFCSLKSAMVGVVTSQKLANAAIQGIFFLSLESQLINTPLHRKPQRPTCAHGHELEHRVLRRMQWKRPERLCEEKRGTLDIFLKALGSHRKLSKRAGIGSDLCFSRTALRMDGGGGLLRQRLVRRHI